MEEVFNAALPDFAWGRPGGNRAWVLIADGREWSRWHEQALRLLDDAERLRIARMRNPEAQNTLVVAYALHRMLVGRYLAMPAASVPLWRDPLGCPRVGEGLAAASLSHAGSLIAMAVGEDRPLGVDIEPASRVEEMHELADNICHPAELAALDRLAKPERDHALLSLWTRKEAILKALGIGFSRGEMNEFAVPDDGGDFVDRTGQVLRVESLDDSPSWFAAVACSPADSIQAFRLSLGAA